MNDQAIMALKVLAPAALFAGLVMLIAWWPRAGRRSSAAARTRLGWVAALALGGGFIAGLLVVLGGWPGWPPRERWMWLLPIASAAIAAGIVMGFVGRGALVRAIIAVFLSAAIAWMIQPLPAVEAPWRVRAIAGAGVLLWWIALEPLAQHRAGALLPAALCITFAGLSMIILEARFANLSLATSAAAAALGAITFVALLQRRLSFAHGGTLVAAALLVSISVVGWMYRARGASVTALHFILIGAAPLMLWLGELPIVRRRAAGQATLIRLALVAGPVAAAIAVAPAIAKSEGEADYPY